MSNEPTPREDGRPEETTPPQSPASPAAAASEPPTTPLPATEPPATEPPATALPPVEPPTTATPAAAEQPPADPTAALPPVVVPPPADAPAWPTPAGPPPAPAPASAGPPSAAPPSAGQTSAGQTSAGLPPAAGSPVGPPPIVPPLNPWQTPGGSAGFPAAYSGPTPPPGYPAGGFPPPPGAAWPQPAKPRTFGAGLIAAIAVFGVVLLGCIGAVGAAIVHSGNSSTSAEPGDDDRPAFPLLPSDGGPAVSGTDDDDSDAVQGPQASPYAVKDVDDLDRVCDDNVFFPQSPKYAGKAPHPIAIMIRDRKDMDTRIAESVYSPGYSSSKSRTDAWNVYFHPTRAQLTACVDLVGSGGKVKTCKFDDPKPDSLPLKVGTYQITLFETATHKQLFSKKINGDDRACPTVVLLGSDRTLYTGITDRYYVELLKKFVEK
jgi:hypothetical protein